MHFTKDQKRQINNDYRHAEFYLLLQIDTCISNILLTINKFIVIRMIF